MINDEDLFEAAQRVLEISGHSLASGDDVVAGDIVGRRYVVLDNDPPVTARLFSSTDELRKEVEDILRRSLQALGGRRYVEAIDRGAIGRDEFLALAGAGGEVWLATGEKAILGASLDRAPHGSDTLTSGFTASLPSKTRL